MSFNRSLPEQQRILLEYLRGRRRRRQPMPDLAAMQRYMGWQHRQSVTDCLERLEEKGYVRGWKQPGPHGGTQWELVKLKPGGQKQKPDPGAVCPKHELHHPSALCRWCNDAQLRR